MTQLKPGRVNLSSYQTIYMTDTGDLDWVYECATSDNSLVIRSSV